MQYLQDGLQILFFILRILLLLLLLLLLSHVSCVRLCVTP